MAVYLQMTKERLESVETLHWEVFGHNGGIVVFAHQYGSMPMTLTEWVAQVKSVADMIVYVWLGAIAIAFWDVVWVMVLSISCVLECSYLNNLKTSDKLLIQPL